MGVHLEYQPKRSILIWDPYLRLLPPHSLPYSTKEIERIINMGDFIIISLNLESPILLFMVIEEIGCKL